MSEDDVTCRDLYERASAFVDGALEPAAWAALRAHLAECGPCEAYVEQLGLTIEILRGLPGRTGREARAGLIRTFERWASAREGG